MHLNQSSSIDVQRPILGYGRTNAQAIRPFSPLPFILGERTKVRGSSAGIVLSKLPYPPPLSLEGQATHMPAVFSFGDVPESNRMGFPYPHV